MENNKQPWELRSDDVRTEDKLATFIIFTEDEVSERVYFKSFETERVKVNAIGNQKSDIKNVFNAIEHCRKEGLFDNNGKVAEDGPHVWCVYDRDYNSNPDETLKNDKKFTKSMSDAEKHNIKVAWSNDNFELWVLLHYEDVDEKKPLPRTKCYERLTKITESDDELCSHFSKFIDNGSYNYKKDLKKEKNFKKYILPILQDKTRRTAAIERAERLENYHVGRNVKPHEMCPCTKVHHLVKELLG